MKEQNVRQNHPVILFNKTIILVTSVINNLFITMKINNGNARMTCDLE